MKLKATRGFTYATRRLKPGDEFEARERDARLLLAVKKAREIRAEAVVPPPPPAVADKIAETFGDDDLKSARALYEATLGKKPFYGWSAAELREKIATAKASDSE